MEIITTTLEKEIAQNYLNYSMSVITNRALPDVRDGLKPVHRRILYTMYDLGLFYSKPHKKSARVVGQVLAAFHPHGDSSVYEALVRFAQNFSMRYPLIDGQGNMGSIHGDEPAAMRYTEVKLSKIADYMFTKDIKEIVEFKPNFSEDEYEPTVLPSLLPQLLVNGSMGIAVGMACNFAPHNLKEVIDGIQAYIKNKNITIEELMKYIQGPDFPTGGIIVNQNEIINAYKNGRGRIRLRGKYKIEEGKKYNSFVIYEIPYNTTTTKILEQIHKLFEKNKDLASCIKTLRDESAEEGIRLVIEYYNNKITEQDLANIIFNETDMEINFNINNTCLVNGRPKTLNLKELIEEYYNFQIELIINSSQVELDKIIKRLHILEGYIKAITNIEDIITIIKSSTTTADALIKLQNKYQFTTEQCKAILELKLSRLTSLNLEEIKQEQQSLSARKIELEEILQAPSKQDEVLINKLNELLNFSDARRTHITQINEENKSVTKEKPKPQPIAVFIDDKFNIKHNTKITNYKYKFLTTTDSNLLIFTNNNKIYKLPVTSTGKIQTLLQILPTEEILLIIDTKSNREGKLLFTTAKGKVKLVPISEFIDIKRNNITASKVNNDDKLLSIQFIPQNTNYVIFINNKGYLLKTDINNISEYGRNAAGVTAMRLDEDAEIIYAQPIIQNQKLLICYKTGEIQSLSIDNISPQNRGTKGIKIVKDNNYVGKFITGHITQSIILYTNKETKEIKIKNIKDKPAKYFEGNIIDVNII